jgi:hypothetical protein
MSYIQNLAADAGVFFVVIYLIASNFQTLHSNSSLPSLSVLCSCSADKSGKFVMGAFLALNT